MEKHTIDLTPTWSSVVLGMLEAYSSSKDPRVASEFRKMANAADKWNAYEKYKEDKIFHVWGAEDVLQYAKHRMGVKISREEAKKILACVGKQKDASTGINWDVIECNISNFIREKT